MAYDRNQPLGIIGAMDIEIELLQKKMKSTGETHAVEYAGMLFMEGTIGNTSVVLVKCGVGMVNAAICAEVLIDTFKASAIINTGVGGSLDNRIDIGDVVIATDAVNHLMDVANLGYHVGETPGTAMVAFPTNLTLHNELSNAADELGIKAHSGRIASGDRFVREDVEKRRIVSEFDAVCCEMEGAAIAQACFLSEVPCAIVRAISDKADGTSSVDYRTFEDEAAKNSAELVAHVLHTSLQG
jgi:adenosylhomocysteine nucleosidase